MFANFFLTKFDKYIKYTLGLDIVRYADDFVIGHSDLEYLKSCIPLIRKFATEELKLTIHPDKLYMQECSKGVVFVGGIIKKNRLYCGRRSVGKMYQKVHTKFKSPKEEEVNDLVGSINSYLGLMKHFKTYKLRKNFVSKDLSV